MANVTKLHNRTLYKVDLDVTKRYVIYVESNTKSELDREIKSVVDDDMYELATDYRPEVISYSYTPHYVTCDQSFEDFINETD